jgi:hypothetical protein
MDFEDYKALAMCLSDKLIPKKFPRRFSLRQIQPPERVDSFAYLLEEVAPKGRGLDAEEECRALGE